MKKTYKIDVDCANCANKMEDAAKKTPGVKNATVNFMALKMIVEFEDGQEPATVMQQVLKNCKKVETTARSSCNLGGAICQRSRKGTGADHRQCCASDDPALYSGDGLGTVPAVHGALSGHRL